MDWIFDNGSKSDLKAGWKVFWCGSFPVRLDGTDQYISKLGNSVSASYQTFPMFVLHT